MSPAPMTTAGKEGRDVRIESPRSTERDVDEPVAVEPETDEAEAAESEETDREDAAYTSEYESEHDHRVGHEPEIAEPAAAEPETGSHGRADEEPAAYEPRGYEPNGYEPNGYEPNGYGSSGYGSATHEPVAGESETGAHGGAMDEHGIDEERGIDEPVAAGYEADEPVPYTPVSSDPMTGDPMIGEAVSGPGDPVNEAPTTEPPEFGSPLIATDESARFHEQIHQIQGTFVDDPRQSVRDAEHLLEDIVRSLTAGLEERRRALTSLSGEDGSGTEELRQALRSYRSLATQLLGPES